MKVFSDDFPMTYIIGPALLGAGSVCLLYRFTLASVDLWVAERICRFTGAGMILPMKLFGRVCYLASFTLTKMASIPV